MRPITNCCCFFVYFSPHRRGFFLTVSGCGGGAVQSNAPCWTKMSWRCLLRTGSAMMWSIRPCKLSSVIHNHILPCLYCVVVTVTTATLCSLYEMLLRNFKSFCSTFLKQIKNQHLYTCLDRQNSGVCFCLLWQNSCRRGETRDTCHVSCSS